MKRAFSMIEIIFVIVILGVLASVAIPKLNVTRDDANIAVCIENTKIFIDDLKKYVSSKGELPVSPFTFTNSDFKESNTTYSINILGNSSFRFLEFGMYCGRKRDLSTPPSVLIAVLQTTNKCKAKLTMGANPLPFYDYNAGEIKMFVIDANSSYPLDRKIYNRLTELSLTQQPILTGTGYEGVF